MESRKRPHADDGDLARPKKRAVSDDRASPSHLNGTLSHSDEPKDGDNVELFRKEAIFRRMKQYSREAERNQAQVADLERRRSQCEAGLAALEACWTQLIGTIRSLVKPEDIPSVEQQSADIRDLTVHVSSEAEPEYVDALRDKMQATADIVKAFVHIRAQGQGGPSEEETLRRVQETEAENSALRSELSLVRTKLRDAESQKEKFREGLVAAEKRADRLQSRSLNPSASNVKDESADGPSEEKASSPQPPVVNGAHITDSQWQHLAEYRETKLQEYEKEVSDLKDQLQVTQLKLKAIPDEIIRETASYKDLLERASLLDHTNQEAKAELVKLTEQLDTMQTTRQQYEDSVKAGSETAVQEMKALLAKRDVETLRLRDQRDQYHSELNERKAKDAAKTSSLAEFESLAETRAERIAVLESENKRLKTRLAANEGDNDLVTFLWSSSSEGPSYVEDLKRRLSETEARASSLEKTLSSLGDGQVDIAKVSQNEADLRRQVEQVQKQLEKYQAVYGDSSSLPPETAQLSEELQRKQDEIEKLRIQDKQREQAESALYSELDKLSAAWETLDRQVKSKVYDLSALEDRIAKAGVDRAKAENKFYAAMRDKEGVDLERKNLARNLDKAGKAVDKLSQSEKALTARMHDLEKELIQWKKVAELQKEQVGAASTETTSWRLRFMGERKSMEEIRTAWTEQSASIEKKRAELRKLEESLIKSKKDAEKQATKLKSMSTSSGNAKETELQSEIDKCMSLLKCSTCHMNMRNTVITKCMHSFCKSCVEARIATRQRKCPACNLPFSQGEVQQLYFQ
ncbi:BRE1-domain-containing protein [Trametes versicolor FP-101664 SS1]|uniref:BRE1-domain-containing protein n=1 Tax=Trametes versicolor (strain FP-101664) TaxID=717944 RepID=UPI0004621BAC|nr:BRE1-domain-containing protein [Trametes versicolor FP-101664 SS1]EIW63378.1 BRE1-domain-containing protein [Trametes versicolor FP-101664 SS1]